MAVITNIQDLKRIYERRVPRMFYDYCESGSWTEQTFRENTSDFDKLRLRQHSEDELAHYADGCGDIEYLFPFGVSPWTCPGAAPPAR